MEIFQHLKITTSKHTKTVMEILRCWKFCPLLFFFWPCWLIESRVCPLLFSMHTLARIQPLLAPRSGAYALARQGRSVLVSASKCRLWDTAASFPTRSAAAGHAVLSRSSNLAWRRAFSDSSSGFSHIDPTSNNPTMVNVSDKVSSSMRDYAISGTDIVGVRRE